MGKVWGERCPVFFMTSGRRGDPVESMTLAGESHGLYGVGVRGERFRECEQRFLTLVGLLFISLTHVKETNQRKRA